MQAAALCERDQATLVPVQANQDPRTYPLLNTELDGRYHLIGGLGQGGVGTVYLANHIHLDQLSAVKFLDVDMLGEVDEEQREESLQDFVKEAKLAMMLRHDYVVRVMDYGVHDRCPFLVMEYVPGPSLLRRMNAGEKFSTDQCINVITRLAEALSAFHDRKLVHRDLKPANVILDPRDNGELTLVDLGLVKDLSNEARSSTHPLALRGTPGYLAPEQVPSWVLSSAGVDVTSEKQPVDTRVDIFALGVLGFELLSGQPPYPKGMSPTKVIVYTCTMPTPDLATICPEVQASHPWFVKLILDMMAKRPSDRPLDAREVLERLKSHSKAGAPSPNIANEIQRVSQALSSHIKPTPLATPPSANLRSPPSQGFAPNITPHPSLERDPQSTALGSLIPPPVSLRRQSGQPSISDLELAEESTVHYQEALDDDPNATIDEPPIHHGFSRGSDGLSEAHTEIADRPLSYQNSNLKLGESDLNVLPREYRHESNSSIFWLGVVLVSAIIGGASVLFSSHEQPPPQTKFVLGAKQSTTPVKTSPLEAAQTSKASPDKTKPIRLGSYEPPTLRRPTKVEENNKIDLEPPIEKEESRSFQSGVVEVEIKQEDNTQLTEEKPTTIETVEEKARKQAKKRTARKTAKKSSSPRNGKPLTDRQYKLLKLQVENLLRNQRISEAKRKLLMVKRKLKPSDEFYMEINMLLDSISL